MAIVTVAVATEISSCEKRDTRSLVFSKIVVITELSL